MIQGKWFLVGGDLSEPLFLRQRVFGRGRDPLDDLSQQAVVYRDGAAVGAARLWWADGAFMLGDVGVLPSERGKGFGDLLVRLLLFKALSHNAAKIALDAPPAAIPFFEKYGFQVAAEGEEAAPVRRMEIRGEDVQLSHCGGDCANCHSAKESCAPKALR